MYAMGDVEVSIVVTQELPLRGTFTFGLLLTSAVASRTHLHARVHRRDCSCSITNSQSHFCLNSILQTTETAEEVRLEDRDVPQAHRQD